MRSRLLFLSFAALAVLIAVSAWAASRIGIGAAIADLAAHPAQGGNPWFVATLCDAYFGFLWFWAWVAYKERTKAMRAVWLVLICALGNMAMAAYMLIQLWRLPPGAGPERILLRA